MKFPEGIIKLIYREIEYAAKYTGRQKGFKCMVCGKGRKCFTFDLVTDITDCDDGNYDDWSFCAEHIKQVSFYQWLWLENTVVLTASSQDTARIAYKRLCDDFPGITLYESTAEYNSNGTYTAIFLGKVK